jgi:hypothetical protein
MLAEIGFLQLILSKSVDVLTIMDRLRLEIRKYYQEIIASSLIVVVGMCHDNRQHGSTIMKYIPTLLQYTFKTPGILEALFYLT